MDIIADTIHPDEPCWGYFTGPRLMPGYGEDSAERMVEFIFVIRGDAIAKYVQDFGPADDYPYVPPLMMPSYGENPVGLMQWHGERHRHDEKWGKRIVEYKESSTLFNDILVQNLQAREAIANRSVLGKYQTTQRNGYSGVTTWRRYRDERNRRTGRTQL